MGLFSNIFGKKPKPVEPVDFSVFKVDMHSHLIPGIDDGAQTLEDSIELIKALKEKGFTTLITTPHVMSDFYRNTPEIILSGMDLVRNEIEKQGLGVTLHAAAEYYLDREFSRKIKEEKLLSFGKENYVLFELSYLNEPDSIHRTIFDLQVAGYKPILAHPERYPFYYSKFKTYHEIKEKGALLQLNINSLTGYYSPQTQEIAERMVDEGLIDFVGTDCHKMGHVRLLETAKTNAHLRKLVDSGKVLNSTLASH